MKFAEIIPALLEGKKVRMSWWGEGMSIGISGDDMALRWTKADGNWGFMCLVDHASLASENWEVVRDGMTWAEAQEAMSQGKKVRRTSWVAQESIRLEIDPQKGFGYFYTSGDPYKPVYSARHATDWEVVEP